MAYRVWIFGDLPVGTAAGPSYMVESWHRELSRLGLHPRLFTPASGWRRRRRDEDAVTFRTVRHVGFPGDYHARFSSLAELFRARKDRPHVVLVATLGRVGVLGITLAAFYSIPLVLVVSTDTTGAAAHYNTARVVSSGGVKPAVLLLVSRQVRAALFRRSGPVVRDVARRSARLAARCAGALHAQAREIVLLSGKCFEQYAGDHEGARVTVFPAGIDRLPAARPPAELCWRPGALRVLYVGRLAPEKGLPLLVGALREATDRGLDVHLTLVGGGPEAARLTALAQHLAVADRFSVLGPYPRAGLAGIYASADVFAFPSLVDTQAFVLNEAAHEALPLLVSDSANSVVRDGESALVVLPDPVAYAEALARLRDPQLRRRLGIGARRRALDVGEAAQTARLAGVLLRAIDSPRGRPAPLPMLPSASRELVDLPVAGPASRDTLELPVAAPASCQVLDLPAVAPASRELLDLPSAARSPLPAPARPAISEGPHAR